MAKGSLALPAAPKTDAAQRRLWAAQEGLGAIKRAEQVKQDPRLMRDVQALARQEQKALAKVTGGKSR